MSIDNSNEQPDHSIEIGKIESIRIVGIRTVTPSGEAPTEEQIKESRLRTQRRQYRAAHAALKEAGDRGFINPGRIQRVLDFGAGSGGATAGIIDIMWDYDPHIDVVELDQDRINSIRESEFITIPPENILHGDGIAYLQSVPTRGIPPYDLITAFSLSGPLDMDGRFFRSLATSSSSALNPDGNLLITSGMLGMYQALRVCRGANVPFHFWEEAKDGVRPPTLILPQSSCSRINPVS